MCDGPRVAGGWEDVKCKLGKRSGGSLSAMQPVDETPRLYYCSVPVRDLLNRLEDGDTL